MVELRSIEKDLSIVFALLVRHHSIQDGLFCPFRGEEPRQQIFKGSIQQLNQQGLG